MIAKDLADLLKGCRPVKDSNDNIIIQSILNMQVVCLTTDDEFSLDDRFENPFNALKAGNSSYGEITFSNKTNKEVIIPTQMAVMTKQSAQNHGMTKAGYVDKNDIVTFHDAGCVQGSQTGHFRNTSEFRMLPISMREMVFDTVGSRPGLDRIYPSIMNLGNATKSGTGKYLDKYFSKYDKKLEQFIAHFERPKNLIGIIVFIDGEIVAIDKFPSFTYAEQVWDVMIRDCYGSLAIISELENKTPKTHFTDTFNKMSKDGNIVNSLDKALKKTKSKLTKSVNEKIQEILDVSFDYKKDDVGNPTNGKSPKSYMIESEGYIGQVIVENEFNHLVSVVKRETFNANNLRKVNELRRKARRQDRFSL
ncbi:MAG: ARPP-1 family domain-containing protein [bacterium]